ncbi:hypothetical protein WK34_02340 [Burkholderia vietnamiensis]|nr:hypothetical protein WK34_02340 [Burkholderia vietnamiensis]
MPMPSRPRRFACLQGKALRAIPAARCLAPLEDRRTGCAGSARSQSQSQQQKQFLDALCMRAVLGVMFIEHRSQGVPGQEDMAGRAVVRVAHRAACGVSPLTGFHRSLAPLG